MAKPPFELLSNGIIKNLFLNVNRQTELLTFVFSSKVERKDKGFNCTPHFCSLPQGERRDGSKNFKRPLTLALSHKAEREKER
jgi:hypothetical protein